MTTQGLLICGCKIWRHFIEVEGEINLFVYRDSLEQHLYIARLTQKSEQKCMPSCQWAVSGSILTVSSAAGPQSLHRGGGRLLCEPLIPLKCVSIKLLIYTNKMHTSHITAHTAGHGIRRRTRHRKVRKMEKKLHLVTLTDVGYNSDSTSLQEVLTIKHTTNKQMQRSHCALSGLVGG